MYIYRVTETIRPFLATLRLPALILYFYSMLTTDQLYALLEARRAELGLSMAEVSRRAIGRGDGSLLHNIKRGSSPTYETLSALCRALGLTLSLSRPEQIYSHFSEDAGPDDLLHKEALRSGYLPIPWHELCRKPGSAPVAFSPVWMAEHTLVPDSLFAVRPDRIVLAHHRGKGSLAIIDTGHHESGKAGTWCYLDEGKVTICLAAFDAAHIFLIGTDPLQPLRSVPKPPPDTFKLLGRVRWMDEIFA